ncbi:hypothetical protein PROFUN_10752 [Planoprotostelium fungivorum]|uniref:Uncharacterized protein n=1 Tax=Planoprotostelium fungivorum TaxID=1890364 RepID=A0A2P6N7Z7_9EUKA|nr:hypothetical protein PROFUN_10752 [Planoprotostelium fungivorum]
MPTDKPKVLFMSGPEYAKDVWNEFIQDFTVLLWEEQSREDFIRDLSSKYDGIQAIYRAANPKYPHYKLGSFDREIVSAFPSSMKIFVNGAVGYNDVAVDVLSEKGILFCNTASGSDNATADTALWLILSTYKNTWQSEQSVRAGVWRDRTNVVGRDPAGDTVGILGLGNIGKAIAVRCKAIGMKVQYHNRNRIDAAEEEKYGVTYKTFDELLSSSDTIVVAVPLTSDTKHILNAESFKKVKRGVIIVNISRGGCVDESALVDAIKAGKVSKVGLDVFEEEPKIHPDLLSNEKHALLPHIGGATVNTFYNFEAIGMQNIKMWLKEGKAKTPINLSAIQKQ